MCTWPLLRLEESKMYWWLPAWFKIYVPYEVTCYLLQKWLPNLPGCISRLCVVVSKIPFVQVKQHLAEQVQKFDNAKAESEAPVSPSSVGRSPSAGRSRKETNSQRGWHRGREVVL